MIDTDKGEEVTLRGLPSWVLTAYLLGRLVVIFLVFFAVMFIIGITAYTFGWAIHGGIRVPHR